MLLHHLLEHSRQRYPNAVAVEDDGSGTITYLELKTLADRLRDRLRRLGVGREDRVGIYLPKSIDSVAAIFGILETGAAYVPVDPGAPVTRNAYILSDCAVKVVIVVEDFAERLQAELIRTGHTSAFIVLAGTDGGRALAQALSQLEAAEFAPPAESEVVTPDSLAYILYTSGSTGNPKGVMLSHRNALCFIDWCSAAFQPDVHERFSSHAPFHFDLSILDIYVPIKHGATLVLIGTEIGKDPVRLAALISDRRITSWYSTPSILSLLAQYGRLQERDYTALRTVLFAGEVFPVKHLRTLKSLWPEPRYFNLYGPTETNVCTFYEIPSEIPAERTQPYPIGKVCPPLVAIVVDEHGNRVSAGQEGEFCISGPGVTQGYWNLPERTAQAFLLDSSGKGWYKTGDIVVQAADGDYVYVGRRDRMIKKRGYRVELGEIEAGLYRHPAVKEAAVVALTDEEHGVRVKAFLSCKESEKRPSLIDLKRFCAENLPIYMVPDLFSVQDVLPKTSTDKIDYQRLTEIGE
jgi:amino acid adenylation domain-containing protein